MAPLCHLNLIDQKKKECHDTPSAAWGEGGTLVGGVIVNELCEVVWKGCKL